MKTQAQNWFELRKIVIELSEIYNWTTTNVLTGRGVDFLNYILPKTSSQAAFTLATEIIRNVNDASIGAGYYHLFRLPQKLEEDIFTCIRKSTEFHKKEDAVALINELKMLCASVSINGTKGPVMIGLISELSDELLFASLARHYYEAFKNNYKTYPYLN